MLKNKSHNPDVLSCIANLSSDEVFTPPELANKLLDILPQELFEDKNTTFLDPACKSGVFLREIAKRLDKGLEKKIANRQKRINHILSKQLYGLAITELTALMSRRSLYCSKNADSKYSVCTLFDDEQGNILYERIEHTWDEGRCVYCGANITEYQRDDELESHAYSFIHTEKPEELFEMKFDVIIGNPPYQMSDGGDVVQGARKRRGAIPLYHLFVEQAKKMKPRYLCMITPSRWFSGGRGLDTFRDNMLADKNIRVLVDYPNSSDCFEGVEIKGGVSYFLWSRDEPGLCEVKTIKGNDISIMERYLKESFSDVLIRYNKAITILHKVMEKGHSSFSEIVSPQKPFGFRTYFKGELEKFSGGVTLYGYRLISYVKREAILENKELVDKHKVLISMAYGAGEEFPHQILNIPFYAGLNTCCTETYLVIGPFDNKEICQSVIQYISTKFFRLLVLMKKSTQHGSRGVYEFVPMQDFTEHWTDEKLYKKYDLNQEEIDFIESMIRPMELGSE